MKWQGGVLHLPGVEGVQAVGQDHFFVNVLVRPSHLGRIFPAFSGGLPGVGHQLMYWF